MSASLRWGRDSPTPLRDGKKGRRRGRLTPHLSGLEGRWQASSNDALMNGEVGASLDGARFHPVVHVKGCSPVFVQLMADASGASIFRTRYERDGQR